MTELLIKLFSRVFATISVPILVRQISVDPSSAAEQRFSRAADGVAAANGLTSPRAVSRDR